MAMEVGRRRDITVVEVPARFHSDMNILKPNVARSYDNMSYQIIKRPQADHPHVLVARADTGKFHYSNCNFTISLGVLCKVLFISKQKKKHKKQRGWSLSKCDSLNSLKHNGS